MKKWIALAALVSAINCARPPDPQKAAGKPFEPAPAPPKALITTATFEPVYRAGKTIQGATEAGVSLLKFTELMQAFATELGIAKDHELNASDRQLLAIYRESFEAYQDSRALWLAKLKEGPVFDPGLHPDVVEIMKTYSVAPYPNGNWNADVAIQAVWKKAGERLDSATALYLGKPTQTRS